MNRKFMVVLAAALLLVPATPMILASAALTVTIGPKYYNAGNTVTIRGTAPPNAMVNVAITYASELVFTTDVKANSTGAYQTTYSIPATASTGIYKVTAKTGTDTKETAYMVTTVSTSGLAQQLITSAEASRTLARETIQGIVHLNYTLPQAVNMTMTQGGNALAEAKSLYAQGLYVASAEASQRAMVLFKNAMTLAIRSAKTPAEGHETANETIARQIDRLTDEADHLSTIVTALKTAGKNTTAIEPLLKSADANLASATTLLKAGNISGATAAVKAARGDIQEAVQLIKALVKDVRKDLMEEFKNHLHDRLNATEGDLNGLKQHIMASNMTAAMLRFGAANSFIHRAESSLKSGNDDGAINDLEEATTEYNTGVGALDGNGYSQGLKQSNTIRAQIQALQQLEQTMKAKGKDTSDVEAQIQQLQSLLSSAMSMMQNGNANGANKLFDDAEQNSHGMGQWMGRGNGHGKK